FHKPHPNFIDRENLYPRRYHIPDFSFFSREDGQLTLEHIARFIIQCGELMNYENFASYKLRLFANSLTSIAFTCYSTLSRNSVCSWQGIERLFHTQFFRAESGVCVAKLSRVTERGRIS
ncbi:hypothetical protein P3X46_019961, partial [Hevea brasiliensis]